MTALELIGLANQVLFVGLFGAVAWHALHQPSRARLNTVLLFGSIASVVVIGQVAEWLAFDEPWLTGVIVALLSVAPLAMLRLLDDFSGTPRWVQQAGAGAFVIVVVLELVALESQFRLVDIALIIWFGVVGGYAAFAFARAAGRSRGITRRRMTAVAAGAVLFIGAIVGLLAEALLETDAFSVIGQVMALASVLAFFLGFAPPAWIRRAWREPDLRSFLQRSVHLAGMADDRRSIVEIQQAATDAFGANGATIGLVDESRSVLRYVGGDGEWLEYPDDAFIGGHAFTEQRRIIAMDAVAADPENAAVYRRVAANTVIAAPITADDRRLGVLTVYAERAPIFIEDDLWLLELLADQTAILLDARALSIETASIRSREDAARLKEEFLSAAAHDLRTPLTVVLGQAELMERRLARDPNSPVDAAGVARIAREARRLRDLVSELLDAQRFEEGAVVMDRHSIDLRVVLDAVQQRLRGNGLDLKVIQPDEPVMSSVDRMRMEQVIDNLVGNALKYTASGDLPEVHLRGDGELARVSVVDRGVGIPDDERERIFERFYRASNVQSVTDTGMGLGLYICRRIIESHGGRLWVEATPGGGSTFIAAIPAQPVRSSVEEREDERLPITGAGAAADA